MADMLLDRAALLAAATFANLPKERLEIPELGGFVYVRGLTGRERDEWERSNLTKRRGRVEANMDSLGNARARLAVRCLCDEQGGRLFEDRDADALGALRSDVLSRIYNTAQRLSNVTDDDLAELKNASETAAGTDSSSVSPTVSAKP
jgi:hypothetical protein